MTEESRELYRLMAEIMRCPGDLTTRRILADWLEEHDEPELADGHRNFCSERGQAIYSAEKRLHEVADGYARGDYNGMLAGLSSGDYCFSDDGYRYEIDWDQLWEDLALVSGTVASAFVRQQTNFSCAC